MRICNAEAIVNAATAPPMSQSAEDAYVAHHAEAAALLEQLQEALFDLPAPDGEISINWAHVGTVAELKRQLAETLAFVSGRAESQEGRLTSYGTHLPTRFQGRFAGEGGGGGGAGRTRSSGKQQRRAQMDQATANLRQRVSAARKAIPKGKGPGASDARKATAAQLRADRRTIAEMRSALGVSRGSPRKQSAAGAPLGGKRKTIKPDPWRRGLNVAKAADARAGGGVKGTIAGVKAVRQLQGMARISLAAKRAGLGRRR